MRADLFSRVAWQLQTRSNVRVYAWLPVFSFDLSKLKDSTVPYVERESKTGNSDAIDYRRVSPFSEQARKIVGEIYEDLAIHSDFSGLLFHDDAYLNDFEDASEAALEFYTLKWNMPDSIDEIRNQPEIFKEWTQQKTRALIDWTDYLAERVRFSRPTIKTARNLYASVVLDPHAEDWFAQSLPMFLDHYDYTAVMAMPYMEGARRPEQWLTKLVSKIAQYPGALDKTVFELQAVDWRKQQPLDSKIIARHMDVLQRHGAYNFGYYPDDFIAGHPQMAEIRPIISLSTFPYTR
jgi:biofilm PGA synthesis lipoprotein PgaB